MAAYKNFAVVGYGFLASKFLTGLAQKKSLGKIDSLVVLSRSDKAQEEIASHGAELRQITSYTDSSSLQNALRGIDVVISTVSGAAVASQPDIARAAKASGAQLFVPSDFASNLDKATIGPLVFKNNFRTMLREEIKLPYTSFYTGGFTDLVHSTKLAGAFGFDFVNGKFSLDGDGEAEISYTDTRDIASFLAHVLTSFPKEKLEWQIFRIEGERISWNTTIAQWEARTGRKAEVTHSPIEERKAKLAANPADIFSYLVVACDSGNGVVGPRETLSNSLYPEWKPRSVIETILELYKQ